MPIFCLFLTAWLGLQGWTLAEIVGLKTSVAELRAKVTTTTAAADSAFRIPHSAL